MLHPDRVDEVYFATNVDPAAGTPLISATDGQRHYEILRGNTTDGKTWRFAAVTHDSTLDNLRPIVPKSDANRTAVLWFRGKYQTYRDYQCQVVALILDEAQ